MGMMVSKMSLSFGDRKDKEVQGRPLVLDHQASTNYKLNQRAMSKNMRVAIAGKAVIQEIRIPTYVL